MSGLFLGSDKLPLCCRSGARTNRIALHLRPVVLSVSVLVKGLQELSGHGVDLDVTRQVFGA